MATWGDLEKLAGATIDQLQAEPPRQVSDDEIERQKRKGKQTHEFREKFFKIISISLVGTLVASVLIMILYVISQWGDVSAAVVVGFNAAVVVDVLGLAFILASYLFPRGGGD